MKSVTELKVKNYNDALRLIGITVKEGKIIGVTNKPGLSYKDGYYFTVSSSYDKSKHYLIAFTQ